MLCDDLQYALSVLVFSLFTDLLFSQMIVERANENKNRGRLMTANARGWGLGKVGGG